MVSVTFLSNCRTDLKVRSRRTRKVNHTKEVFKLIDDDDIAENDRPGDITNDREEPVVFDGGNFEIEKNATGKLKGKERYVSSILVKVINSRVLICSLL